MIVEGRLLGSPSNKWVKDYLKEQIIPSVQPHPNCHVEVFLSPRNDVVEYYILFAHCEVRNCYNLGDLLYRPDAPARRKLYYRYPINSFIRVNQLNQTMNLTFQYVKWIFVPAHDIIPRWIIKGREFLFWRLENIIDPEERLQSISSRNLVRNKASFLKEVEKWCAANGYSEPQQDAHGQWWAFPDSPNQFLPIPIKPYII